MLLSFSLSSPDYQQGWVSLQMVVCPLGLLNSAAGSQAQHPGAADVGPCGVPGPRILVYYAAHCSSLLARVLSL